MNVKQFKNNLTKVDKSILINYRLASFRNALERKDSKQFKYEAEDFPNLAKNESKVEANLAFCLRSSCRISTKFNM